MRQSLCCLAMSLALFGTASAELPIFSKTPDAGAPIRNVPSDAVVADYAVSVDVLALAENLARKAPERLLFLPPAGLR